MEIKKEKDGKADRFLSKDEEMEFYCTLVFVKAPIWGCQLLSASPSVTAYYQLSSMIDERNKK
jgi:hypothetical protein